MTMTTEFIAISIAGAIAAFSAGVQWGIKRANGKISLLTQEVVDLKERIRDLDSRVGILLTGNELLKGEIIRLQTREEITRQREKEKHDSER